VVATATPKDLSKLKISHTGQFLKKVYAWEKLPQRTRCLLVFE
jgi:hypothetical protein